MKELRFYKSAWGYNQTNIDFYVVVKETDKTVTLAEIDKIYNDINNQMAEVEPSVEDAKKVVEAYSKDKKSVKAIRRTFKKCFATPTVKIDDIRYASLYEGNQATETRR